MKGLNQTQIKALARTVVTKITSERAKKRKELDNLEFELTAAEKRLCEKIQKKVNILKEFELETGVSLIYNANSVEEKLKNARRREAQEAIGRTNDWNNYLFNTIAAELTLMTINTEDITNVDTLVHTLVTKFSQCPQH